MKRPLRIAALLEFRGRRGHEVRRAEGRLCPKCDRRALTEASPRTPVVRR
jgi:hypothetical protein